MRQTR